MDEISTELRAASARGDAFASLCTRDARDFFVHERNHIADSHAFDSDLLLFALVDFACLPEFCTAASDIGLNPRPLIGEDALEGLREKAGHFVLLPDRESFERVFDLIWGRKAGLFFQADAKVPFLLDHLRSFSIAMRPDGELALFRYYDPRVFGAWMGAIDADQYDQFFDGKIETAFYETDRAELAIANFGSSVRDIQIELC